VATLVLPFAILISLSHVLYGGSGPGDGFTAGVVSGLAVALWYLRRHEYRLKNVTNHRWTFYVVCWALAPAVPPHHPAPVVVAHQLYRAATIQAGIDYHH